MPNSPIPVHIAHSQPKIFTHSSRMRKGVRGHMMLIKLSTLTSLILMIKKKQIFHNLSKGLNQSKLKIEEEGKAKSHSKSKTPLQYRYNRNNTLMKIPIITTTMRITKVNPEAIDSIEANILDDFSEVKILMAEANVPKTHIKVNIKVTIIKAITTKAIMVYTTMHIEAIIRVIIMANLKAEVVVMVEVITMRAVAAGLIIEAITTINTINGHDDDYQPDQYGPPCALCGGYNHSPKHCFKGEHDINDIMEKMNISGHHSQQSGLYS